MSTTRTQITVLFEGDVEPTQLRLKPVGMLAAERRWGGNAFQEHPIEATLLAAWASAGMPGGTDGFEGWAGTIAELVNEAATDDGGDAPVPTSATSTAPSPTSQ